MDTTPHLAQLQALATPAKAAEMAAYHKADRPYLGVSVPQIDDLTDAWRAELSLEDRLALAAALWRTNIHEARIAAAKLLTQARIRPDQVAWELIQSWLPDFDAWAIADHVSIAGQKRLVADRHGGGLDHLAAYVDPPCGAGDDPALDQAEFPETAGTCGPGTGSRLVRRAVG